MTTDELCVQLQQSFAKRLMTVTEKDMIAALGRMQLWEACQTFLLAQIATQLNKLQNEKENE